MQKALPQERKECKHLYQQAEFARCKAIFMEAMAAERLGAIEEALEGFNTVRTLISKYRKQATAKIERLMKDVNEGRERCLVKLRRMPINERASSTGSGESKLRLTQNTNFTVAKSEMSVK